MMGRDFGGTGRSQLSYSPRFEDRERRSGWGVAPPSRHLWVGNLSPHVKQSALSEQFFRFGDLDNISFIPGRTFAFVNYKKEEDAIIAQRGLQGFILGGMPIKIEFAKGDRASVLPQDEDLHDNDARPTMERGDLLSRRDQRLQRSSAERSYEKSKDNKNGEPSEMLWIGFPASIHVDELILRRAFAPFGEIDKVTTFPNRTYAFVRYKSVVAACRAKEALHGKLFNNPRVSIYFAKNDNPSEQGRGAGSGAYFPHVNSNFQRERSFEGSFEGEFHRASSPGYIPNMDQIPRDPNIPGFSRSNFGGSFELGRLENPFEHHRESPAVDKPAPWLDFSFGKSRRTTSLEDSVGREKGLFPFSKKMKTDSSPDNELPEYGFSDFVQEKRYHGPQKSLLGLPDQPIYSKSLDSVSFTFKGTPEHLRNVAHLPHTQRDDSSGNFGGPSALSRSSLQKFSLEPHKPPPNEEWKWEGTIAKGGNVVCRARSFPVGKVLDFMLPEVLNCTARTGLDMLAKHYYQAANSWVVFFVPETDADMGFYNEFMHFLGEKQRAAVAKLSEKVSLFLVPPSDFSEHVLKVPGKVSISGVILKFQQSNSGSSSLNQLEGIEPKPPLPIPRQNEATSFHGDTSYPRPSSPDIRPFSHSQRFFGSSAGPSFLPPYKPGNNLHARENAPDFHEENIHDDPPRPNIPLLPSNPPLPNYSYGAFPPVPNMPSRSFENLKTEEYRPVNPRASQEMTQSMYTPEASAFAPLPPSNFSQKLQETKPQVTSSSLQLPLQPEQLAQLATILGQQNQSGKPGLLQLGETSQPNPPQNPTYPPQTRQSNPPQNPTYQPQQPSLPISQALPHVPHATGPPVSQAWELKQQSSSASTFQQPIGNPMQPSSQQVSTSSREETEADPQKRLQATLQLAAALLQQIQQHAKT